MPDNKQIDPLLLRMLRPPGRGTNTMGAGLLDPSVMRTLQLNSPGIMGGGSKSMPGFNPSKIPYRPTAGPLPNLPPVPGMGPQPDVTMSVEALERNVKKRSPNPSIAQYTKFLKEQNVPYEVRLSPKFNTAYIHYGPEKDRKIFTLRVPHPDKPHVGKVREGENPRTFIDTAGTESIPPSWNEAGKATANAYGTLTNAAGGSFSDINNVKDAIRWQLGQLTPVGSEPLSSSPDFTPRSTTKGTAFFPKQPPNKQKHFMDKMLHKDEPQGKMPPLMGGDSSNALHSSQLSQRFNLVTPQDLGNFGSKPYDPMTDPAYLQLMALVKKYGKPPGNDW